MNFNNVVLLGRITKDITVKQGPKEKYADFTIAYNREHDEKKETDYIPCRAYGKTAENIGKYFGKGRPILVSGRITQSKWTDAKGDHDMIRVYVREFEFVDPAKSNKKEFEVVGNSKKEYDGI